MTSNSINQYDTIELLVNINPNIQKGMNGVVLEKLTDEDFEIEVIDNNGNNIGYLNQYTFTVNIKQIRKKN